jgi:methyl-accepting chemotaxis protein
MTHQDNVFINEPTNFPHLRHELWDMLKDDLPNVLNLFYDEITNVGYLKGLVQGNTERLKDAQYNHWENTFLNGFTEDYFERTHRIGVAHVKVKLPPELFIQGYFIISQHLIDTVTQKQNKFIGNNSEHLAELLNALNLVIYMDMSQSIASYSVLAKENEKKLQVENLAQFSGDIASPVESIATASEEFNASLISISDQTQENNHLIEQTGDQTKKAVENIDRLHAHVDQIREFISIIENLAAQTNLLALNASIEAARAGDSGRGFAVVPEEVKKLSINTDAAAGEISAKINDIGEATNVAVECVSSSNKNTELLRDNFNAIAVSLVQQREAFQDINTNIDSISQYIDERSKAFVDSIR